MTDPPQDASLPDAERLGRLLDAAGDGICALANDDTIVYLNRRAAVLLDHDARNLLGRQLHEFVAPEDLARYLERWRSRDTTALVAEWRWRRRDGSTIWMRQCATPLLDSHGSVTGACVLLADVSSNKAAQATAADVGRHKDDFLATLAHELRNPLAPIANGLHVLHDAGLTTPQAGVVGMLQRQVDTMVRLIDDLLEVSRLNEGDISLRRERVELASVLQAAIETTQPRIDARNLRLIVTQPREAIYLDADRVRLCQVFANLLSHAAGQTPAEGLIWLTVEGAGGSGRMEDVFVSVRDNGVGLSAEQIDALTRVFASADHQWQHANDIGIGLALARQLVVLHGGRIAVFSEGHDRGAEFTVRLPVVPVSGEVAGSKPAPGPPSALSGRRVLVVDDNQDAADSLGMLLRRAGARVEVVYDGFDALDAVLTFRPEVILLDLGMPGLNGYELARRVRERREMRSVMLVAQTGWGQEHERQRSREAGIDHHLVKPVDFAELEQLIADHFRGSAPT